MFQAGEAEESSSRRSSTGSRGSVRITITNLEAEQGHVINEHGHASNEHGHANKRLDSPGIITFSCDNYHNNKVQTGFCQPTGTAFRPSCTVCELQRLYSKMLNPCSLSTFNSGNKY